ncbi:MAG: hypothetical protein COB02_11845 [Candidatus Cloacimonadota bacterium]|nr:MAG: hypothetical protein COB02_11845 [Candidatus Cloacimonadota bacterium]
MSDHKKLYNLRTWRRLSKQYRLDNPLCAECQRQGKVYASEVVDHIIDHKGDYSLFWNKDNLQALCMPCHNRKTAQENPEYIKLKKAPTTIVCGSVGSGVDKYIQSLLKPDDVVIDFDSIYEMISGCDRYIKPKKLFVYVNKIRNFVLDIFSQESKVNHVYISMGVGDVAKIKAMQDKFEDSKVIILNTDEETCYRNCKNSRKMFNAPTDWLKLIRQWHDDFNKHKPMEDWIVKG